MKHGQEDRRPAAKPSPRARIGGWLLIVSSIPFFLFGVAALVGVVGTSVAYLAGFGEEVTVTVTESSRGESKGSPGSPKAGMGYYLEDGDRVEVEIWGVEKGQKVEARLPVLADEDEPGRAYAGFGPAFWDGMWGLLIALGGFVLGWLAFRGGRVLISGSA